MRNLLRTGAEWAQQQRHLHTTEDIVLGGVSMKATPPATDTEVERGGVKLTAKFSHFIVRTSDLIQYNITVVRGMELLWGGNKYEVTLESGHTHYFNDPSELDVVIVTVKK